MLAYTHLIQAEKTKKQKAKSKPTSKKISETKSENQLNEAGTGSPEKPKYNNGRWSKEEHRLFMEGIELYGKDWKKVQLHVGTRTSAQSRSHAQKVLAKTLLKKSDSSTACSPQKQDDEDADPAFEHESKEPEIPQTSGTKRKKSECFDFEDQQCQKEHSMKNSLSNSKPQNDYFIKLESKDVTEPPKPNKRFCDQDISMGDNSDYLDAEGDELGQQLLSELLKKPTRMMSFSHFPEDHFKDELNLNSDIGPAPEDFERRYSCVVPDFDLLQ